MYRTLNCFHVKNNDEQVWKVMNHYISWWWDENVLICKLCMNVFSSLLGDCIMSLLVGRALLRLGRNQGSKARARACRLAPWSRVGTGGTGRAYRPDVCVLESPWVLHGGVTCWPVWELDVDRWCWGWLWFSPHQVMKMSEIRVKCWPSSQQGKDTGGRRRDGAEVDAGW